MTVHIIREFGEHANWVPYRSKNKRWYSSNASYYGDYTKLKCASSGGSYPLAYQDDTTTNIWLWPWTYRGHNHHKAPLKTSETPYKCVQLQMCHLLHLMPYTCLYPIFTEREREGKEVNRYCCGKWVLLSITENEFDVLLSTPITHE